MDHGLSVGWVLLKHTLDGERVLATWQRGGENRKIIGKLELIGKFLGESERIGKVRRNSEIIDKLGEIVKIIGKIWEVSGIIGRVGENR